MTHEEVYAELSKEREAVTVWWRHQLDDQRRRALKCTRWPMHIWKEYTSPRKNRYLFFSRVFDKHMKRILTGVAVVRYTSEGLAVYTTWLGDQKLISPMVLTPHMWKRYAERVKVDKHGIDLIKHYFLNNPHGKDSDNQKVRTFITYDMTTGMQQAEFEDKRSQIITDREMYERAKMFYQKL